MSISNFLEDFVVGQKITHAIPRTITEGDASIYISLTGNRQPLYCARTFSNQLGYSKMPLNDFLLFHIAFGRTVQDISLNAIANLGYADVRFVKPVYAGDTIRSESKVIGIKENSNKSTGIVYVHSVTKNQDGDEVLSWKRWVMIPKNNKDAVIKESIIEELPKIVSIDDIQIPKELNVSNFDFSATGSLKVWDDFNDNEFINHSRGITIDETAHTLATNLYQNNAKLHFDAHMMKDTALGQRLIYGGHIISLCHSISFEGLENTLNIVAINGGTHSNPTLAGDTIYAKTIVVGKDKIDGRDDIGLLRLRLIGIKNLPPSSLDSIYQENTNDKIYSPNVVLNLDYSVIMPRGK